MSSAGGSEGTTARRTRSVGTKLTADEYARLEALAAQRGLTPGEWVREILLAAFDRPQPEATATEQALRGAGPCHTVCV